MESPNGRERSRSPLDRIDYEEDQEDIDRYDKSRLDSDPVDREQKADSTNGDDREQSDTLPRVSSRTVYISNIPFSFRWQTVKDFLKNKVGMVDFVEMSEPGNAIPRGCAVVAFRTLELTRLALECIPGTDSNGRKLRIFTREEAEHHKDFQLMFRKGSGKRARERSPRNVHNRVYRRQAREEEEPISGETYGLSESVLKSLNIVGPLTERVFVANIDFQADLPDLEKVFSMAGPVKDVELSKDRDGRSRGFAVIHFEHPVHAVQAISMFHNQKYFERTMLVRMDKDLPSKPKKSSNLPPGLAAIGAGLGVDGRPIADIQGIGTMSRGGEGDAFAQRGSNMSMGNMNPNNNFNQMPMMGMNNYNAMGAGGNMPVNNSFGNNPMPQGGSLNYSQGQMGFGNFPGQGQNMNSDSMRHGMPGNNMMTSNVGFGDGSHDMGGMAGRGSGPGNGAGRFNMGAVQNDFDDGRRDSRFEGRPDFNSGGQAPRFRERLGDSFNNSSDRGFNNSGDRGFNNSGDRGFNNSGGRSFDRPYDRSFNRPSDSSFDRPSDRSFDRPSDRSFDRPSDRSFDRPSDRSFDMGFNKPTGTVSRFRGKSNRDGGAKDFRKSTSQMEGKIGVDSPNVIQIDNLPFDYKWQNLKDLCRDYGDVRFAEMKGEGIALVRFADNSSAVTAVELLDRQRFDGRSLQAKII